MAASSDQTLDTVVFRKGRTNAPHVSKRLREFSNDSSAEELDFLELGHCDVWFCACPVIGMRYFVIFDISSLERLNELSRRIEKNRSVNISCL